MKLTPRDWCDIKRIQAIKEDDPDRARELRADANKFELLAQEIEYLQEVVNDLSVRMCKD